MAEYCRDDFGLVEQADDDFKMWQGLIGPHYTPSVSEDGTLSWTNNGGLQNPEDVSIKGPPGEPGPPGGPGPGVPTGGTTGQLLAKASDEDYDGEWIDPPEMDAGHVSYDPTETYDDGTVGKELGTINSALSSLSAVTEIIDTASGAIASFPDGAGTPMRSLLAQIEPQQDLHGYDAPWAGGAGANKLRTPYTDGASKTGSNVTYTVNSAGQITIACSASASGNLDYYLFGGAGSTYESTGLESGTYTFAVFVPSATTGLQMFAFDEDGTSLCGKNVGSGASQTFSIDGTKKYRMFLRVQSGNTVNTVASPIIVSSSTAPTAWTPYSNVCPISGWTGLSGERDGKNLIDWKVSSTAYSVVLKPNSYTLSWNGTFSQTGNWYLRGKDSNGDYYTTKEALSLGSSWTHASSSHWNYSGVSNPFTFTVPDGCTSIEFLRQNSDGTIPAQLEVGSSATDFEAYQGETITCTWQSEAGTVYDGYIDVVSGELVATHGISTESSSDGWRFTGDGIRAYKAFADIATIPNTSTVPDITTNYLTAITFLDLTGNRKTGITLAANSTNVSIRISSEVSDTTALNTYLSNNPLQIVYKLATPIVYQLTPQQISTLLGNNTVFVDTGSVSVTYPANLKLYIDKKLA